MAERRDGRGIDPGPVVTGLVFLAVAAAFLVGELSGEPVLPVEVLAPLILVGLGLAGVVRILTRSRRR